MANPTQDLLIFAGIPLAVVAIVFALVYASPGGRGAKRYRPGRPYRFAPVWFLARPETDGPSAAAITSGHGHGGAHAALTATDTSVTGGASTDAAVVEREHPGVTGGASDRW